MSRMKPANEYEALVYAVSRLAQRFPDADEDAIMVMAAEELQAFSDARVRDFVPVLVERNVVRRLRGGFPQRAA
jgi:hypothetical protein